MKLVLADPTILKDSISVISDLVNEASFKITRDGLEMIAMDPANVAMVIFKLLSSSFTEYDIENEREIAINLANFRQILKRVNANDILTLDITEDNKLHIKLKGRNTRTFSIPLIELEEKEQRIPNLTFPVNISTTSNILTNAIADADIIAESVTFSAEPDTFAIAAEGNLSKANIEIKNGDETKIQTENQEKTKSKYSIEYLKKMINAGKLADNVQIFFSKDYPLKLEYKVMDKLLLSFILAPRVEND
ncbi:proliferating cell nuclear antigen (pcna) [Candidatus Woesearchaeota archaeon CG10_big_fil_rev_8_21_14_0_10_37_12]|nr:MAG: proliferating cell nuclear antigen (pcna) [Candidatus Woesearchaeota archaeon CG10_big_fil_rev_8_21_14_0_10_37_12]